MRRTIFEINYDRLVKLGIVLDSDSFEYGKSQSAGYMDLIVEKYYIDVPQKLEGYTLLLSHYFEQNGDLCSDPSMVIAVYPEVRLVEALNFEQSIPPIYQVVYPEKGKVYPKLQKDLNSFLGQWLRNLISQKHSKEWFDSEGNHLKLEVS